MLWLSLLWERTNSTLPNTPITGILLQDRTWQVQVEILEGSCAVWLCWMWEPQCSLPSSWSLQDRAWGHSPRLVPQLILHPAMWQGHVGQVRTRAGNHIAFIKNRRCSCFGQRFPSSACPFSILWEHMTLFNPDALKPHLYTLLHLTNCFSCCLIITSLFLAALLPQFELRCNKTLPRVLNNLHSCAAAKGLCSGRWAQIQWQTQWWTPVWQISLQLTLGMNVWTSGRQWLSAYVCSPHTKSSIRREDQDLPPISLLLSGGQQHSQLKGQQVQSQIPIWNN